MATAWYLCPFDVIVEGNRTTQQCAMMRHIPFENNPEGDKWDEAQVLGSHAIVKVVASDAMQAQITADTDFISLPSTGTVPGNRRNLIRRKLVDLGYTAIEVDATGWDIAALLELLTSKTPHKTLAQIEARLPG